MNPTRKPRINASKIKRALHFRIRFSFTELFHSYLIWPLISCAPDQYPDKRQFARLKNHCVLANHTRVGWQKEGGTGADHVAATGDYREDAQNARNETGSPNKYAEGK